MEISAAWPVTCCELETPPTKLLSDGHLKPLFIVIGPFAALSGSRTCVQSNVRFTISRVPGTFVMPCADAVLLAHISGREKYFPILMLSGKAMML